MIRLSYIKGTGWTEAAATADSTLQIDLFSELITKIGRAHV